jgi:predicted transcriptional regulator of viral defense system
VAQTQQGFFTAKQAIHAGFAEKTHAYHVRAGNWIRQHRGVYRLTDFPTGERPDLMLWFLWSQNRKEIPEGTYSHETALSLHELSDVMPSRLQMTVPKQFRRNSRLPEILELHRADLAKEEVQEMYGVRVTRPLQTIADLVETGRVDRSQLRKAVTEALERGLITREQMDALADTELRNALRKLAGRSR